MILQNTNLNKTGIVLCPIIKNLSIKIRQSINPRIVIRTLTKMIVMPNQIQTHHQKKKVYSNRKNQYLGFKCLTRRAISCNSTLRKGHTITYQNLKMTKMMIQVLTQILKEALIKLKDYQKEIKVMKRKLCLLNS
jgi:hypothetical protein